MGRMDEEQDVFEKADLKWHYDGEFLDIKDLQ